VNAGGIEKWVWWQIGLALTALWNVGLCWSLPKPQPVMSITYRESSGSLPPRYAWSREVEIALDRVVASSYGGEESGVTTFRREVVMPVSKVRGLFRSIESLGTPPESVSSCAGLAMGSGGYSYTIVYQHSVLDMPMDCGFAPEYQMYAETIARFAGSSWEE